METFDLMESRQAECSEPFDGYSVALATRMPALTVGQLYPSGERNCCL